MGDDLLVTNPKRVQTAIEKKACNALLLKVPPARGAQATPPALCTAAPRSARGWPAQARAPPVTERSSMGRSAVWPSLGKLEVAPCAAHAARTRAGAWAAHAELPQALSEQHVTGTWPGW